MMHVLKDEKLGVDREYVAVDRKAEVGETIVIVEPENTSGDVANAGHYGLIIEDDSVKNALIADFKGFDNHFVLDDGIQRVGEAGNYYHVLEPTDIVHIDGERYRLEDRKAEVGEKIIVTEGHDFPKGLVDSVKAIDYEYDNGAIFLTSGFAGGDYLDGSFDEYSVLVPIDTSESEPKESDVITVLANLGAEVAELKRTVSRHQAEINALHEDKVRLGEQLAKVMAVGDPKALSFTVAELAQIFVSLKKAGL
ncbi:hypothetical protein ACRPLG_02715 [Bacillus safensis]|uniref:hypothetical protein n=1 Tax=Bacillus safensis TaxID=561879 RepID=UPI003D76EC7A